jgi:hypothetical protein
MYHWTIDDLSISSICNRILNKKLIKQCHGTCSFLRLQKLNKKLWSICGIHSGTWRTLDDEYEAQCSRGVHRARVETLGPRHQTRDPINGALVLVVELDMHYPNGEMNRKLEWWSPNEDRPAQLKHQRTDSLISSNTVQLCNCRLFSISNNCRDSEFWFLVGWGSLCTVSSFLTIPVVQLWRATIYWLTCASREKAKCFNGNITCIGDVLACSTTFSSRQYFSLHCDLLSNQAKLYGVLVLKRGTQIKKKKRKKTWGNFETLRSREQSICIRIQESVNNDMINKLRI